MDRLGGTFDSFDGEGEYDDHGEDRAEDHGAHSNPPPSPVGQDERRMQVRAFNHWSELLGGQALPHIEDLEPEFLGDFGPYSVLLDFSTGSTTPTVQFIGSELRGECRMHDLVEELGDIPRDSLLARIADNYLKVVSEEGPVSFEDECTNARGQKVAYRGILLPYSSDHDTIDFVYAVINWKEVADSRTADELLAEIDRAMEASAPVVQDKPSEARDTIEHASPASVAEIVQFHRTAKIEEEPVAEHVEPEEAQAADPWARDDNILELRDDHEAGESDFADLPAPSFGQPAGEVEGEAEHEPLYGEEGYVGAESEEGEEDYAPLYGEEGYVGENGEPYEAPVANEAEDAPAYAYDAAPRKRDRLVDALGNPIGGAAQKEEADEPATGGITTAADYGLPEWDDEEPEGEDVDELVNPLADIDLNSRLLSLVNAGTRGKKTVDLATLSDTPAEDEEEPADPRQLFRPKAPSVDTLLSPEPYDAEAEEAEAHAAYEYDEPVEARRVGADVYGYAPVVEETGTYGTFTEEAVAEEVYELQEPVEAFEPVATDDEEPVAEGDEVFASVAAEAEAQPVVEYAEKQVQDVAVAAVEDEPVEAEVHEVPEDAAEVIEPVAEEEPLELGEELILEEVAEDAAVEEDVVQAEETYTEVDQSPVEIEAASADAPADEIAPVSEDLPATTAPAQEDSLVGLQAAVRDLAEAARTTDDLSRRALYEAVGRAFDVSIKAVIAAEAHAGKRGNVIEHLPVDILPEQGPEMALVMVRRTANGGTEIVGEVPHDSILMETAALKLAAK